MLIERPPAAVLAGKVRRYCGFSDRTPQPVRAQGGRARTSWPCSPSSLAVRDVAAAVDFYREAFGAVEVEERLYAPDGNVVA